jgi:segregation and condensation protein A
MQLLLDGWEGPLGVLVHLIKTQAMNIFNIPIVLVTRQYLDFVAESRDLSFDRAGEYLSMAAELVEIKAKYLIPALQNKLNEEAQSLEDMSPEDPRRPLVEKLLEFEAIKAAVDELETIPQLGRDSFASAEFKRRNEEFADLPVPVKGNAFDLAIALERALLRFANEQQAPQVKVRKQRITIHSRMISLQERFRMFPACALCDLFGECKDRYELIVTIMASLELVKLGQIVVEQTEIFGKLNFAVGPRFGEDFVNPEPEESKNKEPLAGASTVGAAAELPLSALA